MEHKLIGLLKRETEAIPCPAMTRFRYNKYEVCNGYAEQVDSTKAEIKNQRCGKKYECCVATFFCRVCGRRIVADLEAPEVNW